MSKLNKWRNFKRNYTSYSINNSINSVNSENSETSFVSEITDKNIKIQKQNINQLVDENNLVQDINLTRKLEFDRGVSLSYIDIDNEIYTIPYSFKGYISFIFKKLIETLFNICLVLVCLYYLISFLLDMGNLGDLNLLFSISFHLFILVVQILLATIDYISIYLNDNKVNNQIAHIYDNIKKKFVDSTWKEIKVGHILKIYKNEIIPADIILLESMDSKHQCYIDNSSINGNFDMFRIKKACNDTQSPNMKTIKFVEYVKNIKGIIKYGEPNSNMYHFKGRLKLDNFPRASDISLDNFLIRGSTLKNVRYIYGLVVYTGMETKMMMTLKNTQPFEIKGDYGEFSYGNKNVIKKNQFDRVIIKKDYEFIRQSLKVTQCQIIFIYIVILIVFLLMGIHKGLYLYLSEDDYASKNLGYPYEDNFKNNSLYEIFLGLTRAVLTFHFFMPFNWFGLIKISYYILSCFAKWDEDIKRNKNEIVEIINPESLTNFGQIRHIVTDKTGTLTKRKVEVKLCSIHGKLFNLQMNNDTGIYTMGEDDIKDLDIVKEAKSNSKFASLFHEFIISLSICHSIKAIHSSKHVSELLTNNFNKSFKRGKSDNFSMTLDANEFASAYCEEVATFKILKKFGYQLAKSKKNLITIKVNNKTEDFQIIGRNKYHVSRKKMSVVVRKEEGGDSFLLCKAYDISAFDLLNPKEEKNKEIEKSKNQIKELTKFGFRYFILFRRELSIKETSDFIKKYKNTENFIVKSEEHLNKLAIEYEKNLSFLGIIFFKEIIDPDLEYSTNILRNAGIKIWIASGDTKENVLSIGRALALYDPESICGDFNDQDKPEDLDIKMSALLMQFLFPSDKINKMKNVTGEDVDIKPMKEINSQRLNLIISGNCFSRICKDHRNYQSLATLLSYCTNLLAYKFSPNNKLILCQMIKNYCIKNSRLLAIGDGFNDFSMLREADLSIGIDSKEILQLRNTCDAIVSSFSQIVNLILVHGTWNYKKILEISLISFYLHFLILIPKLLYLNENFNGFSFYDGNTNLIFTLNVFVLNLFILFMITFDVPVEKALIILNMNIFKDNIYDNNKIIFIFGIEALKSLIDSAIIYVLNKVAAKSSINYIGKNVDISLFGIQIFYSSYILIIIKVLTFHLKYVTYMHFIFTLLCIICLIGITFIDKFYQDSVLYGITHLNVILSNVFIVLCSCTYEVISRYIVFLLDYDFLSNLTIIFKKNMSDFLFVKSFEDLLNNISKEIPRIQNKLNKISFTEVLNKIYKINNYLDPALENMADVTDDEVSNLRIRKPMLKFFDKNYEKDYIEYCNMKITVPYIIYLFSLTLFLGIDLALRDFELQKIARMIYIFLGFFLLIPKIKRNFSNIFPFYFTIILIIELVFIYVFKSNNDIKLCLQTSILINFPLFYCPKNKIIIIITFLYTVGITPALFINDFDINNIYEIYQKNFLYKNLCLVFLRQMCIYGVVIVLFISSHFIQLRNRIEFLKYQKTELELKKDNLIMINLIPEFVRAKLQKGERGAAYGYEEVTIVFCDISNFNLLMAKLSPKDIILFLDQFYSILDKFCQFHGLQKIETVGKTYMAAGGIIECERDVDINLLREDHSIRCFKFALDILFLIEKMVCNTGDRIHVKIGIHRGKVIPAVVGNHKPQFSLIGDAVNTTSRMSSNGEIDCITCSEVAYDKIIEKNESYKKYFVQKDKNIKGKGKMTLNLCGISEEATLNLNKIKILNIKDQLKIFESKPSFKNISPLLRKNSKSSRKYSKIFNFDLLHDNLYAHNIGNINLIENKSSREDSMLIIDNSKDSDSFIKEKANEQNNIFKDLNKFDKFDNGNNHYNDKIFDKNSENEIESTYTIEKKELQFDDFINNLFSDSFLLYCFKNIESKNIFRKFENALISKNIKKSVYINLTLFILLLYNVFSITHYVKIDDDYFPYLTGKTALVLLLVIFIFLTDKLVESFPKIKFILFTVIYLLISINNMVYNEKLNSFNLINMTVEEIVILTAIESCGILNYLELNLNILFHMIIYIIDITLNPDNILLRTYNIFLIVITIIKLINIIILYYDMTTIFLANQKESKTLVETEKILFNLMPLHVVQNMKDDIPVADVLENVTLLYADIVNFTNFGDKHRNEPIEIVKLLTDLFENFDNAAKACNVYKVHTIGDCYVVMGFNGKVSMNERDFYEEAKNVCKLGEEMIKIIKNVRKEVKHESLDMRIGIHTGRVIAGILGSSVVRYDIFGTDTLIANKMESSGKPGRINISEATKKLLESKDESFNVSFNRKVYIDSLNENINCYLIEKEFEKK